MKNLKQVERAVKTKDSDVDELIEIVMEFSKYVYCSPKIRTRLEKLKEGRK